MNRRVFFPGNPAGIWVSPQRSAEQVGVELVKAGFLLREPREPRDNTSPWWRFVYLSPSVPQNLWDPGWPVASSLVAFL